MTTVFAPGVFDLLHVGHVSFLEAAAALGDRLVVGIQEDRSVEKQKGRRPFVCTRDRYLLVRALRCADDVVTYCDPDLRTLLAFIKPDVLAVGPEYGGRESHVRTLKHCYENKIDVSVIDRTPDVSTTAIRSEIERFWQARAGCTTLTSFGGDPERLERETEREVGCICTWGHQARRNLLDLGCGDGRLLRPLSDIWASTMGVDFSDELISHAQEACPKACLYIWPVEEFVSSVKFDTVLLSGLLNYLDDASIRLLVNKMANYTEFGTRILVRTTMALTRKFDVIRQWSEPLATMYSAYYRTQEDIDMFFRGFLKLHQETLYQNHEDTAVQFLAYERQ